MNKLKPLGLLRRPLHQCKQQCDKLAKNAEEKIVKALETKNKIGVLESTFGN